MSDFDLQGHANNLCGDLSGGTKRKVCASISMLGSPHLILMDEPTRYVGSFSSFRISLDNNKCISQWDGCCYETPGLASNTETNYMWRFRCGSYFSFHGGM